ncbi:MAG TPA: hypothetical protein V6D20_14785 [Candidatus Obscuribacterales bacterium]
MAQPPATQMAATQMAATQMAPTPATQLETPDGHSDSRPEDYTPEDPDPGPKRRKRSSVSFAPDPLNATTFNGDRAPDLDGTILYALLGFTKTTTKEALPEVWLDWFEQKKEHRRLWLNGYRSELQKRNYVAFDQGFDYPPFLAQDLSSMQLTTSTHDLQWWRGIVGAQLKRDQSELQHLHHLNENEEHFRGALQVNDAGASARRGKAPPRITTWHELTSFLSRLKLFTDDWVPSSYLHLHTNQLLTHLQQRSHLFSNNTDWICAKACQIVWHLKQLEQLEFGQPLRDLHFLNPDEDPPFFCLGANDLPPVHALLQPNLNYDLGMPATLRPTQTPAPVPAPPAPSSGPAPTPRPAANPSNTDGRPQPTRQTNPSFATPLKAFWADAAEPVRRANLSVLLTNASSTNADVIQALHLPAGRHCLHFHVKGSCGHTRCRNTHSPIQITDENANRVVAILRRGATAL